MTSTSSSLDSIDRTVVSELAAALHSHDAAPARGIEASIVTRSAAQHPRAPWPFLVHVTNHKADPKIVHGTDGDGDPDLILHYAVLREHGWPAHGPTAIDSIGEIARPTIIAQLSDELAWAAEHAPPSYAVLNACRALRFVNERVLCSKSDGGAWALSRQIETELVSAALAARQSGSPPDDPAQSRAWVRSIAQSLAEACP